MRRGFALGETILDIIFKNNVAVASSPGGAMLNTSVSLGRAGVSVYLISEFGRDHTGDVIHSFLAKNHVKTNYIYRYAEEKTGIALAYLDDQNESHYEFYKKYPDKRLNIELPNFSEKDILIFGSFYSVEKVLRPTIIKILKKAKKAGALLIYDPNMRSPHQKDIPHIIDNIEENFQYADIIRGSHEDFQTIYGLDNAEAVFNKIHPDKNIIYTHSRHGIWLRANNEIRFYKTDQIQTKSTIGAGDSFNAGLIYALMKHIKSKADMLHLRENIWENIIITASSFAADVCKSYENYVSMEFAEKLKSSS